MSMKPFANEPILELRRAPIRAQLTDALTRVDRTLPLEVPVWIAGDARRGDALLSTDPGAPDRVVARAALATGADVDAAVAAARRRGAGPGAAGGARLDAGAPAGAGRPGGARVRQAVAGGRR